MLVDLVAIVLGILFSLRRLELKRAQPAKEDLSDEERRHFEHWRASALSAESIGAAACFLKVTLDLAFRVLAERLAVPWTAVRIVGATLFFAWLAGVVVAFVKRHRARQLITTAPYTGVDRSDREREQSS